MKRLDDFPGHHALRMGRRSLPHQVRVLTLVTYRRRRHFGHFDVARAVARELGGRHLWRNHQPHAWVLMPDHAHLLCGLAGDESLPCLVARIKSVTAALGNNVLGHKGAFWARGFHDHALRGQENLRNVASHLVDDPLRAGLVESPWQWPFWNSRWIDSFEDLLHLEGPPRNCRSAGSCVR